MAIIKNPTNQPNIDEFDEYIAIERELNTPLIQDEIRPEILEIFENPNFVWQVAGWNDIQRRIFCGPSTSYSSAFINIILTKNNIKQKEWDGLIWGYMSTQLPLTKAEIQYVIEKGQIIYLRSEARLRVIGKKSLIEQINKIKKFGVKIK